MRPENQKENKIGKIYLASDHAGFEMKNSLKRYLVQNYNFNILDLGATDYDELDDYPDYIHKAAQNLQKDTVKDLGSIAFVFGGSGEGESMVMNRYKSIRCTTYYGGNIDIIKLGREHNDANSISFGSRFIDTDECKKAVEIFLSTTFLGDRHEHRVKSIDL